MGYVNFNKDLRKFAYQFFATEPFNRTFLHSAALNGHLDVIKYLISISPSLINKVSKRRETPLHDAAINDHLGVVKYLLSIEPSLIHKENSEYKTALDLAIDAKSTKTIKYGPVAKNR